VRGFKVHVSPADAHATPLVAQSIDIETATYSGRISGANTTGFTYTRQFARAADDYSLMLDYISGTTANTDPSGNSVMGFLWWDFTLPTLATEGMNSVAAFVRRNQRRVNFGGTVGALTAWGASAATWPMRRTPPAGRSGTRCWSRRRCRSARVTTAFAGNSFAMAVLAALCRPRSM